MHKLNDHRPFAHGRGDTFHALGPDIADRKDSGKARFEQIRSAMERPAVLNLGAGLDEALCVERETTLKPFRLLKLRNTDGYL